MIRCRGSSLTLLIALLLPFAVAIAVDPDLPDTAGSFSGAKRDLYEKVYHDHRVSFYCGCSYNERRSVDLASCGLEALADEPRAQRIEAEHVFPASQFGNFRQCWREPEAFPECVKSSGNTVTGRTCCERVDLVFEAAHNDLFNLYPAVGEVNASRSNLNWGMVPGEAWEYGRCNIEIDRETRRVEPPEGVMGDIARTMFYMSETYGFRLSDQDRRLYEVWDRQDPPDEWEFERNRRISEIQGRGNPFIERWAGKVAPTPVADVVSEPAPVGFVCGEKRTCGEMDSCEEARFHLEQCGLSRLDGNGDGVPCESLCR